MVRTAELLLARVSLSDVDVAARLLDLLLVITEELEVSTDMMFLQCGIQLLHKMAGHADPVGRRALCIMTTLLMHSFPKVMRWHSYVVALAMLRIYECWRREWHRRFMLSDCPEDLLHSGYCAHYSGV